MVDRVRRDVGLSSFSPFPFNCSALGAFVTSPSADRFLDSCVDLVGTAVDDSVRFKVGIEDEEDVVDKVGLAVASRLARVLVAAGGAFSSTRLVAVRRVCGYEGCGGR